MKNLKKIILVVFIIPSLSISFINSYHVILKDFEVTSHAKESQINRYLELSRTFIDLMTIYGNEYFQQSKDADSELYELLMYGPGNGSFNLDAVSGTKYEKTVGNLTGIGRIPQKGINRDELNLAFKYNEFFNDFYERLEGVQWLYYTSENDFINIYPWIPSEEFAFQENLKDSEYYKFVNPVNNPNRKALWTPVYLDHAGKGMMVTLSSPIYNEGTFMGVISLDITTEKLVEIIRTDYESYLIDARNTIIATDSIVNPGKEPIGFETLFEDNPKTFEKAMTVRTKSVNRLGRYYAYSVQFDKVPWKLFFLAPVNLIIYRAALATLPMLVIGILLFFTMHEFEKSKRAETMLTHSLDELRSYQRIIENAAKCDILTNTFNRRGLKESFNKRIASDNVGNTPISFVIGDIDYFKQFNDTFGHAAGDKVLIEIADIIRNNIGSDDILCRWGGEEFVIILFSTTCKEAIATAEIIRGKVEALTIFWENFLELKGTMTFGVAEYSYTESIEECISKADNALYFGKNNGRNQVNGYQNCEADKKSP